MGNDVGTPDRKAIRNIIHNYIQNEKALVEQLYFRASHGTTIGGFREDIWREMFEQIVPKKFMIEQSVFIIDSEGRISNEVDLAIFDETYTPYIFRYGRLKFLPIEAVAVVIECKSTSIEKELLKRWVESISCLRTSHKCCTRTINEIIVGEKRVQDKEKRRLPTQTATRPIRILCCLKEEVKNNIFDTKGKLFDFIIKASKENQRLEIEIDESKKDLQEWYRALNHAHWQPGDTIYEGENIKDIHLSEYQVHSKNAGDKDPVLVSLLTFNLQLNQLLMLINNPILFPHRAYAEMFDNIGKGEAQ